MAELQRAADVEQRSPEEVVEDAVERYLRLTRRDRLYGYGEGQAERLGIKEEDVRALVKEIRRDTSARGRYVPTVTADSNLWVSAFGDGGKPRRLIDMADAGDIRIDISEFIIDEVLRTRRDTFEWSAERLQEAADQMKAIASTVAPSRTVDVFTEDPADNRMLACAAHAKSDDVVTGDRGLLSLRRVEDIPIVKVTDVLEIVARQDKGRGP